MASEFRIFRFWKGNIIYSKNYILVPVEFGTAPIVKQMDISVAKHRNIHTNRIFQSGCK